MSRTPPVVVTKETGLVEGEVTFFAHNLDLDHLSIRSYGMMIPYFPFGPAHARLMMPDHVIKEVDPEYHNLHNTKDLKPSDLPKPKPNLWLPGKPMVREEVGTILSLKR